MGFDLESEHDQASRSGEEGLGNLGEINARHRFVEATHAHDMQELLFSAAHAFVARRLNLAAELR